MTSGLEMERASLILVLHKFVTYLLIHLPTYRQSRDTQRRQSGAKVYLILISDKKADQFVFFYK